MWARFSLRSRTASIVIVLIDEFFPITGPPAHAVDGRLLCHATHQSIAKLVGLKQLFRRRARFDSVLAFSAVHLHEQSRCGTRLHRATSTSRQKCAGRRYCWDRCIHSLKWSPDSPMHKQSKNRSDQGCEVRHVHAELWRNLASLSSPLSISAPCPSSRSASASKRHGARCPGDDPPACLR